MSQDQQAMTGTSPADTLAADMPSVPGAGTAKSIIENAIHPHQQGAPASASGAAAAGAQTAVTGAATSTGPSAALQVAPAPADAFIDKVFDLPIMGETLTFGKRAVVTEELRVYKRAFSQEDHVTGTVRRERVTVEGADMVAGADDQIGGRGQDGQEEQGGVKGALQGGAQNVQEGAGEAKHGLDGMIDNAVDRLFGVQPH